MNKRQALREVDALIKLARQKCNAMAVVKALELKAKLLGLFRSSVKAKRRGNL